ncbi:MAG: hypothetical protein K6V73_07605 [Firmicutes bacterium]|nr:hypothetical protein [Bacillota bacterium]
MRAGGNECAAAERALEDTREVEPPHGQDAFQMAAQGLAGALRAPFELGQDPRERRLALTAREAEAARRRVFTAWAGLPVRCESTAHST